MKGFKNLERWPGSARVYSPGRYRALFWTSAVMCALFISVTVSRDTLARYVWQNYKIPAMAGALNGGDANLALQIGNYYFNGGAYDLASAEKYFKKALKIDPNAPIAWHQLARIDFLRGDFLSALYDINQQIALHGDKPVNAYYVRGLISGYSGHLDEAAADFQYFLEKKPTSWAGRNDLAWIYFQKGDYRGVESVALTGLEYHPDNPWLLISLGVALLNLDRKIEAKTVFERARDEAGKLTPAIWGIAYPGNNPESYASGLENMKQSIDFNLKLVDS